MLTRRNQPAPVEKTVMGRSAVAVVVLVVLIPTAVGQLTGWAQGSATLDNLGVPHLATVWAVGMLIGSAAMVGSYLARREDDTRILEIGANTLIAIGTAVHLWAVLEQIGYSEATWACGLDVALFVNCCGRALFLGRQLWWVKHQVSA